jgi:hypothetical protein
VLTLSQFRAKFDIGSPRKLGLAVDVGLACLLFWSAHAAYRGATGHVQNCDSQYSLVVAEKLLAEGTTNLRGCVPDDPMDRRQMRGYTPGYDLPYQLVRHTDPRHPADPPAVYYGYPLGSTVLSLPFVETSGRSRGLSMLHPDGRPNMVVEDLLQLRIAGRVAAAIIVLFYVLARFFGPPPVAVLIAAGFAFGSPVWSTLSRALWSHTWMVCCLSVAVILLVACRRINRPPWKIDLLLGAALGTALFWTVFVRAHGVLSAAAIGAYLLLHHWRTLIITMAAGGLWSAGLVAVSLSAFGTSTPPSVYDAGAIDGRDVFNRFAWLMVSPSRGLLVYCPYVAAVAAILIGFRRHLSETSLLLPVGLAVVAHTTLFACYSGWHGGSSYGPRYFGDLLPWFVLATAIAVRGLLNAPGFSWRKVFATAALVTCFGWGVFVHARGANSVRAWIWNARSLAVGQEEAVKEWRHPQFLAGLTFEVHMDGSVTERR